MPAHTAFRRCTRRVALLLIAALPLAAGADDVSSRGAAREHLHLPLDPKVWRVSFEDDGDSATWRYRATGDATSPVSFDAITVTTLARSLAPFPAREMPQRAQALLAGHAPGLTLDVRSSATPDRALYVLTTGRPGDTTLLGLAQDGASALHTVEIELQAGTAEADIARWVDVLDRAALVPAGPTAVD
ncbi:MAG: hypothetical protein ABW163_05100 [Luteimonas sp.]